MGNTLSSVLTGLCLLGLSSCSVAAESKAQGSVLELELQRRDAQTGQAKIIREKVDASKTAIVVVDVWNYHWCTTWCGRAGAMIPRMNRALELARKLGMTVVFSPTDCSAGHAGTPQREAMAGLPSHPLPEPIDFNPDAPWSFGLGSGCMCGGPYECRVNYDNSEQDRRLVIADGDFISSGHIELNNLCREKGITHLIYMGGATNMCLCQKPEGMIGMTRLGYKCILARDITEAHGPNTG
jgi:nicotinamidase-related amidase